MTARKKYIIISVVGGVGWLLFAALYSFMDLVVYYAQDSYRFPYIPMPSNESVAKMETAGIPREDIVRITETWNDIVQMESKILINNIDRCNGWIQNGTSSLEEYRSCESLIYSLRNHEASTIAENRGPLSIINSSKLNVK